MGLLPRRKSFLLKFLLLVPAVWFLAVLFFAYGNNGGGSQSVNERREKRNEPLAKQEEGGGGDKIKEVAPPKVADKEALVEKVVDAGEPKKPADEKKGGDAAGEPNIPKPKKFAIDPDSPIYKHEKNQAGEGGKPVNINKNDLKPEEKKKYDDGWTNNAFNQYVSDMISLHRTLPAAADKECVENKYNDDLPDTSVVVCFHNEAWSVLLRTVHSIVERTPDKLLKEIILVDDFSDKPHLKEPLEDYMSQFKKVKILRLEKREGLIRARLRGFDKAKGKVITFLDSHCECTEGWLEPLLDRIKIDPKTVVCPVIDVIDDTTFEYHYSKAYFTNVGGFDWSLQFNWHPIPERDRKNRKRAVDPVASPTMAGGLFAIDREYFEHLGTYDSGFDIWGGENLELSFKIWMCGGRLEIVPCSHVGHIFRKRSPYKWRSGVNVLKRNTVRLAEVWLDEYKKYYYERINWQLGDYGDISDRVALRKKLNCTSFKWFLDTIYPELFIPGEAIASGEVRNKGQTGRMCLDSPVGRQYNNKAVSVYPCHDQGGNQIRNQGKGGTMCFDSPTGEEQNNKAIAPYPCHGAGGNQYWMLSKDGEIRRDESCVDYAGQDVMIFPCHGMKGNQEWRYDHNKHQLLHVVTNKCMEMSSDGSRLLMHACDPTNLYQQWVFKTYDADKVKKSNSTIAATR